MDNVQGRPARMIRSLENMTNEERLKEGLFSLKKIRLRRDMITVFKYIKDR